MSKMANQSYTNVEDVINALLDSVSWTLPLASRDISIAQLESVLGDAIERMQDNYWGEDNIPVFDPEPVKEELQRVYQDVVNENVGREKVRTIIADIVETAELGLPETLKGLFVGDCERIISSTLNANVDRVRDAVSQAFNESVRDESSDDPLSVLTRFYRGPSEKAIAFDGQSLRYVLMFQIHEAFRKLDLIDERITRSRRAARGSEKETDLELRSLLEIILWRMKILSSQHSTQDQLRLSETITRELEEVLDEANSKYAKRPQVVARLKYNLQRLIRQFFGDEYYTWVSK